MAISRWLIAEKIAACHETLLQMTEASPARERALQEIVGSMQELTTRPPQTLDALRGIEGRVAQAYFSAWRSMPMRWKGLSRKPIAEDGIDIGARVAAERQGQSGCRPSGECDAELRLCRTRKPGSDRRCFGRARSDRRVHACRRHASTRSSRGRSAWRSALVLDLMEPLAAGGETGS